MFFLVITLLNEFKNVYLRFKSFESEREYLSFWGRGNPSNDQVKCGVGFPVAIHLRDTGGPGCIVCSINLYTSWGNASKEGIS